MKILAVLLLSLFSSSFAFASQYFNCQSQSGAVISIHIKNYTLLEYETDWDVDGPYELRSYKAEMWTTFKSDEYIGITLQMQGKMFSGKSGFLKQIAYYYDSTEPSVTMFFCKPGKSKFFQGSDN